MKIYRDLFFNNIQTMLAGNFPVLRALYSEQDWLALIRAFYAHYRCHTPLFTEIAREFLRYLQDFRETTESDPPFLLELAHYEWVEMALELDDKDLAILAIAVIALIGMFACRDNPSMVMSNAISAIAGLATGASIDKKSAAGTGYKKNG